MSGRPFIKVHDSIEDHPKIAPLSDAAFRQLVTGWGWCHRQNTDGRMPQALWAKRCSAKVRRELENAGMVTPDGAEVEFHDYLEEQHSAQERAAATEQRRSAGRAGGLARAERAAKQTASEPLDESLSETQAEKSREEKKTPSVSTRDLSFEEFWLVYPRKVGKGAAAKAWVRAVRSGTDGATIIEAAVRLAREPGREERFTPHPATWLNAERWLDAPPAERTRDPQYAWDV